MNIAFYTATTGMMAHQEGLNIYSNNIANVNTVGYKALRPSFADCIYTVQRATEEDWQTGHGVYAQKTDLQYTISSLKLTEQELDFALPNDGFFAVVDGQNNISYTRAGDFKISNVGDHWELVTGNGDFVLDYEGNHITVPFEENSTKILYEELADNIGVFTFENIWGLEADGNNKYITTERSGEAVADRTLDKLRQALENSNTDLVSDMVHIIESQRAYQLSARMVQTADELARIANNLR